MNWKEVFDKNVGNYFKIVNNYLLQSCDASYLKIEDAIQKVKLDVDGKLQTNQYKPDGRFPIIDQGKKFITGYTNDKKFVVTRLAPIVIFGDHTRNIKFIDFDFAIGADGVKLLKPLDEIDCKFFFYQMFSFSFEEKGYSRYYKQLSEKELVIPFFSNRKKSKNIQEKIVEFLESLRSGEPHNVFFDSSVENKIINIHKAFSKIESLKELNLEQHSYLQLLRQTILQEAVQGKLTKQDKNDEPATELLKRIKAEKQKLIKEGFSSPSGEVSAGRRGKKEKELPPITEDEIPFELPKGWVWCRFRDIAIIRSNLVDPTSYKDAIQVAPDIIEKGTGRLLETRTVKEAEVKSWNHYFFPNQIIYSKIRPNLSKAIIVNFEGLCSADMYPIESLIDIRYLHSFILSKPFLNQVVKTDNRIKMPKINQEELNEVLISLPPLPEQQRIVTKVQQLQQQLSALEKQVQQSRQYANQLLQAVLKEAFAVNKKEYATNEQLTMAAEN